MAIQVSDQEEDQQELKGASSTRSKLAVNSKQFVSQIVCLAVEAKSLDKNMEEFVSELRQLASDRLSTLPFPTTKDEEWKYTDVSSLGNMTFDNQSQRVEDVNSIIENHAAPEAIGNSIVFVNGKYSEEFSDTSLVSQGLIVGNLAKLGDRVLPKLRSHLAQHPDANDYFASLNTACMEDVAIILVPKNLIVENPIQLMFISVPQISVSQSETEALITQPRCLVVAESHSSLTFVQSFVGKDDCAYFCNSVTEVWLAEGAQVNHTKIQWQGDQAIHIIGR
jgi:Fe-S cluster assembly protein SufD